MKKVIYTLLIVVVANVANAQGFLKKIKAKVTQAVEQPVANQLPEGMASAAISNGKWTDPAHHAARWLKPSRKKNWTTTWAALMFGSRMCG
jgi:hypothetical protein